MTRIMVAGIGTNVGKTVVSAILTLLLDGDYWKPVQCGAENDSDTTTVKKWIGTTRHVIHPPAHTFKAPLSPHHAARLENRLIETIEIPYTTRPLIIEGVGGILVPLTEEKVSLDLFQSWNCHWIIVSRHYLGNINHTLLTIGALQQRGIHPLGIFFNGTPQPDSEAAILKIGEIPLLGRLLPEPYIDIKTLKKYVKQWQPDFPHLLP